MAEIKIDDETMMLALAEIGDSIPDLSEIDSLSVLLSALVNHAIDVQISKDDLLATLSVSFDTIRKSRLS